MNSYNSNNQVMQQQVQPMQQFQPYQNNGFQNIQQPTYTNQGYWNAQPIQQADYPQSQPQQAIPQQSQEYILLDGSAPNKKRKYVFVGEVDMQTNAITPLPSFSLEDIRKIVSHEFDIRFGEEKKQ